MAKSVSDKFKNFIKSGGPFYAFASMTLSDGTLLMLDADDDFTASGNGYSEGSESGFPFGAAISKTATLSISNSGNRNSYDFFNARFTLFTETWLLDDGWEKIERLEEGIFTVIDVVNSGENIEITAYDDMYKADIPFSSTLNYPATAQQLLVEVCGKCNITLGSASFLNDNFLIQKPPTGLTGRQVIGYIAQIACGNARIDKYGRLVILSYDLTPFDSQEEVTADEIETSSGIHILSQYINDPDIVASDVTITGVSVEIESDDSNESEIYLSGTDDYVIKIDNPLIGGKEKEAVDLIANSLIGISFRPFSGTFMPNPTIEFMDLAYIVDKEDKAYKTFITSNDFDYLSNSTFANTTESPERAVGQYYSTAAEVYQKAKEEVAKNKTQWEEAIEHLASQISQSNSGLFTTEERQSDGSYIFYMHNKPELGESDIIWKMTAEAIAVTTDGGKSWNGGITVNGEVIASILNTIGLNFDWGVGGTLVIQNRYGDVTFSANSETGEVFVNGTIRSEVEGDVGREWIEINEAVISGGVDDEEYGIIDLCANYDDSSKHISISSKDGKVHVIGNILSLEKWDQGVLKAAIKIEDVINFYFKSEFSLDSIFRSVIRAEKTNGYYVEIEGNQISGGNSSGEGGIIQFSANYGDSYKHLVAGGCDYLHLQASEKINIESIAEFYYKAIFRSAEFNNSATFNKYVDFNSAAYFNDAAAFSGTTEFDTKPVFYNGITTEGNSTFHEQAVFWVASKMYYLSHVSSGGHIVFASDGQTLAYLASSSKKYKDHVRDLTDEEAEKLLNARVVWFKYKENYLDKDDPMNGKEIPGFYAEELEEICPELIQYNNKGEAEDWNYRTMIPLMVKIIEKQQNEINELKNEISKIKETIGGLS